MNQHLAAGLLALACAAPAACAKQAPSSPATPSATKVGFTVSADERGTWSFVAPDGRRLVSLGVNNISPEPYMPRAGTDYYNPVPTLFKGDRAAWATSTRDLLVEHGFNTAGAWSHHSLPASNARGKEFYHTPVIYLSAGTKHHQCLDAFRPDFPERAKQNAARVLGNFTDRATIIGAFLDNEMPWWGKSGWDRTPNYTLLERAFDEPDGDPTRAAALDFLKSRYPTAEAFAKACDVQLTAWDHLSIATLRMASGRAIARDRNDFLAHAAERYYRLGTEAVKAVAPGLLILGTRYAGDVPDPVAVACGKYCDVLSFNTYHGDPVAPDELIAKYWVLGKKPLMITEFAWRAAENASGNPNTGGAGGVVPRQADRADRYARYIEACLQSSIVIGMHWFEFADQSPQGRFDGENSNYGVVSIRNEPYSEVLVAMKQAHAKVPGWRAGRLKPAPTVLPTPQGVTYEPGQHPGRPPSLDLLKGPWTNDPEIWGATDAKLSYRREGAALVLDYVAGLAHGAGINVYGPATSRITAPAGASTLTTDLDGYTHIVLEATAPKGVQINIIMAEAAAGPSGKGSYVSPAGDDGEAFISDPIYGQGGKHTYRIAIRDLKKQQHWGNQRGKGRIEMNAVLSMGIQVQGSPDKGTVTVHRLALER